MRRANGGFGLRAVIVESMFAMALLYLLFPMADRSAVPEQVSSETVSSETVPSETVPSETVSASPVSSESAMAVSAVPLPAVGRSVVETSPRRLPTLHVPAPPARALSSATVTKSVGATTGVGPERREFVVRELEYSRRALAMILEQHLQRLAEPFGTSE